MIAAWMTYTMAVGFLLYAAAMGAEYVARALRLPTRFAWIVAMTAVVALSGRALLRRGDAPRPEAATLSSPTWIPSATEAPIVGRRTTLPSAAVETSVARFKVIERSLGSSVSRIDVSALDRWNRVLTVGWAVASGLVLSWLLVSLVRLRRLASRLVPSTVAGHAVLISDRVGPALLGMLRPRIVLPRWVLQLPSVEQEIILAHEHEHAAALDPALVCASVSIVALQPWNAVLWLLLARLRLEIEADCDARVLSKSGDARAYGQLLVAMYERTSGLSPHVAFAERPSNLQRRIRRITSRPRLFSTAVGAAAIAAIVFATAAWKTSTPTRTVPLPRSAAVPGKTPVPVPFTAEASAEGLAKRGAAGEEPQVKGPSELRAAESRTVTFKQIVIAAGDSNDAARAARRADSVGDLLRNGVAFDSLAAKYHDFAGGEVTGMIGPLPLDSLPLAYEKALGAAKIGDVLSFQVPGKRPAVPKFVVAQLIAIQLREVQQGPALRIDPISGLPEAASSGAVLARTSSIRVTIEAPNHTQYRLEAPHDSTTRSLLLRGRAAINWGAPASAADASSYTMEITSLDSTSQIHVQAAQNGRVIASGEGAYLALRRDSVGIAIEAGRHVPPSRPQALGKPSRSAMSNVQIDAETAAVVLNERRAAAPTGPCAMPDSIAIRGLSRLRDADVRSALGIAPKTPISGTAVTQALRKLYANNNLERNATATCEIIDWKGVLVFSVTERPGTGSSNVLHSALDSTAAQLVELELQRVSSTTDSASRRRLDSQIATLHGRLRSSPGGVAADREATTQVLLALEARASDLRSWLANARLVYTDEYPIVRDAQAEDRAIGHRVSEIRRTM